jgi:hypothetical protein
MPLFLVFCVTGWKSGNDSAGNFCRDPYGRRFSGCDSASRLRNSAFSSANFFGSLTIVTRGRTSFHEICHGFNRRHIRILAGTFGSMLRAYPDHLKKVEILQPILRSRRKVPYIKICVKILLSYAYSFVIVILREG